MNTARHDQDKTKLLAGALFVFLGALTLLPVVAQADVPEPYLQNPIKCDTVGCLLRQIIQIFLGLVAIVSTVMFIYGGYVFLTSGGNAEAVRKGKETLFWASVGIVTVLGSWAAIQYLLKNLINPSS